MSDYKIDMKITEPNTGRGITTTGYISSEAKAAILKILDDDFENELKIETAALKPMSDERIRELWSEMVRSGTGPLEIVAFARSLGVPKP